MRSVSRERVMDALLSLRARFAELPASDSAAGSGFRFPASLLAHAARMARRRFSVGSGELSETSMTSCDDGGVIVGNAWLLSVVRRR